MYCINPPQHTSYVSANDGLLRGADMLTHSKVRDITQMFVSTAALLPPGETTEDHNQFQKEEAENVEKDKASPNGLFNGCFKPSAPFAGYRAPIRDGPDGVDRCPMCTWELEEGMCNSCGYTALAGSFDDDDESVNSEIYSMDSAELEDMLGDEDNHLDFDTDHPEIDRPQQRVIEAMRRRAGLPVAPHRPHRTGRWYAPEDDEMSDITESTGSLRNFVADDMGIDAGLDDDNGDSHISSDSEHSSTLDESGPERRYSRAGHRYQGRRIGRSSPELSDSDHSHSVRSSHQSSQHHEDNASQGGFSPLQESSAGGHSQDIPIQVDSDSDSPPTRRHRRRPVTMSISSDEENNDARGVNIPPSPTTSDAPATTGPRSPELSLARPFPSRRRNTSHAVPPPILIDSSPARPDASRASRPRRSPRGRADTDHRDTPSDTSPGDSTDEEALITRRSRAARLREQSDRVGQRINSQSSTLRQTTPTARTAAQYRQERKRLKLERRRRDRQEMEARGGVNPLGPPQQLSYIGA